MRAKHEHLYYVTVWRGGKRWSTVSFGYQDKKVAVLSQKCTKASNPTEDVRVETAVYDDYLNKPRFCRDEHRAMRKLHRAGYTE